MRFILLFFLLYTSFGIGTAQTRTFGAGLVGGLNAAQVQGDDQAGWHKLGIRAGVRGIIYLPYRDNMEWTIDILYSQRGSRTEIRRGSPSFPFTMVTDYIEVPVLFHVKDWYDERDDFYRARAFGGLSFGRLFRASALDFEVLEEEVDNFNPFDLSLMLGVGYSTSKNFLLSASYGHSLNRLYNNRRFLNPSGLPRYAEPLRGKFLSFQGTYVF